ncbi:MAG: hypothetical protein J6Y78_06550 [Paludibacteraceae bacterium]|nr:hypothetical protein [Paludibacteraceae bacterium]
MEKKEIIIRCIGTILVMFLTQFSIFSQNRAIQGVVIDDLDYEPVPYVSIIFNDSIIGMTNLDGSFQIEVPYTVNRLVLGRAIGFEDTEIVLCENCNYLEIILFQRPINDFLSKKQADNKRKKRFKKIGKIRKEAVRRGIFQSKNPCYKQVFIP